MSNEAFRGRSAAADPADGGERQGFGRPWPSPDVNREVLALRLERELGGSAAERRVVVRQALDLHDSGRWAADHDAELAVEDVVRNLSEAPDGDGLVDRWNWWIGALEVAHGGYDAFSVQAYRS